MNDEERPLELFAEARLRHLFAAVAGILLLFVAAAAVFIETDPGRLAQTGAALAFSLVLLLVLWAVWLRGSRAEAVLGRPLARAFVLELVLLGVPMVAVSLVGLYLLYLPLSYIAPGFVREWALDAPELLMPSGRPEAVAANVAMALLLVAVVPVVEELVFRGFLLGRLMEKYGATVALWGSSLLFAVLHTDLLGSLVFAVFAGMIRLRYDSLVGPMLVHVGNNLVAYGLAVLQMLFGEPGYGTTLEEFRSGVWAAGVGAAIGFPWLYRFYRRRLARGG